MYLKRLRTSLIVHESHAAPVAFLTLKEGFDGGGVGVGVGGWGGVEYLSVKFSTEIHLG